MAFCAAAAAAFEAPVMLLVFNGQWRKEYREYGKGFYSLGMKS